MHFAIVEDEKVFMNDLKETIQEWKPSHLDVKVSSFYTGEEIIHHYRVEQKEFDIIFMDIQLGGMDGLSAAKQLRQLGFQNAIVFTTNHTEFDLMQKSYDVAALHYFEKPITPENIETCVSLLSPDTEYSYTYKNKQIVVPYKSIVYFEGAKNYIKIRILNSSDDEYGKHRKRISDLHGQLPENFIQCHRSYIVNLAHIIMIKDKKLYMRTKEDKPIPIGDTYLDNVFNEFQKL